MKRMSRGAPVVSLAFLILCTSVASLLGTACQPRGAFPSARAVPPKGAAGETPGGPLSTEAPTTGVSSVLVMSKVISEKTPEIDISIRLPVASIPSGVPVRPGAAALNSLLIGLSQQIERDVASAKARVAATAATAAQKAKEAGSRFIPYLYEFDFRVSQNRSDLFSLSTQEVSFSGGAHPMTTRKSYNVDLSSAKMLKLGDLFKPGADFSSVVNDTILKEIAIYPALYFSDDYLKFKTIKPDQRFYLNDGALVVYFGHYEISPYSSGIREFTVGHDKIDTILLDAYRPAIDGGSLPPLGPGRSLISRLEILRNTADVAEIIFHTEATHGAWHSVKRQVKVCGGSEPLFDCGGLGTVYDTALGIYRVDLVALDAFLTDSLAAEFRGGAKRIPGDGLLQAIRVTASPNDSTMGFYLGCSAKPEVTVADDYRRMTVTLRRVP